MRLLASITCRSWKFPFRFTAIHLTCCSQSVIDRLMAPSEVSCIKKPTLDGWLQCDVNSSLQTLHVCPLKMQDSLDHCLIGVKLKHPMHYGSQMAVF